MLVLTRKKNESIHIGKDIKITILETIGDTVKIGIAAPKNIEIYRTELFQAIQTENQQAAASHKEKEIDLAKLFPPKE